MKEKIQQEALKLSDSHNNIILEWATGTGKTLAALMIINKLGGKWNIVIAEKAHKLNWLYELKKWNMNHLLPNIKFFCYASLHKHINDENYVFDETHRLCSDLRLSYLAQIKLNLKRFIGLSATLTWKQKALISGIIGYFEVHKVTLSQAIEQGLVPEPIVYFLGIDLNNTIKNQVYSFSKDKQISCTEKQAYDLYTKKIDYLREKYFVGKQEFQKIMWLNAASARKRFMTSCKTKHAKVLLNRLKDKRFICFTGSIAQSKELSNGNSIHSEMSSKTIEKVIEDFNGGIIDNIFATGMLKEGQNLNNIQIGIILQLDNVERYFIQTLGRSMRALYPEQYVVYLKNTQDEVYVNTVLENFNKDYVKFIDFNIF